MGELPAETRLGAIRLRVGDLERMQDFYETTIGLHTVGVEDGVTAMGANGTRLVELVPDPGAPSRPSGSTGLFHLALLVPTRAGLARTLRRVVESGWRLSGASDHLVSEALYLSDPEGNGIELYRDRPREEWSVVDGSLQMDTLPLDLERLLAEPGGEVADTKTPAGTTLGHVHLQVADLGAAEAFWVDALGLDVTVRGYPGALFTSAGGYHHHVGLNTWAGAGAPSPPPGARGLVRFEVVLPDAAAVDAARRAARPRRGRRSGGGRRARRRSVGERRARPRRRACGRNGRGARLKPRPGFALVRRDVHESQGRGLPRPSNHHRVRAGEGR